MRRPYARALLIAAALLLGGGATLDAQPQAGRVRGEIRDETTQRLLVGARVTLSSTSGSVSAQTDSLGRYEMRVAPGRQQLAVRHLSHVPMQLDVIVPAGGEVVLDLALRPQPLVLAPVRVAAERVSRVAEGATAPAAELARAGARGVESMPGLTELGVGGGRSPGQQPVDPSDVLFVRGSAADLKLVLLDGAPVYSPFHLGGLISVFEPTTLRAAEIHLAGAPARYDGGLAYVMELETRRARRDRVHAVARADALLASAMVEAPLGPTAGLLFSGRSVHGLGVSPMLSATLPYGYDEALLRADVDLAPGHALRLTSFLNQETIALGAVPLPDSLARWANAAVSLRYLGRIGERRVESTLAYTTFDTRLPLGGSRGLDARSRAERLRAHAEVSQPIGASVLRAGASVDHLALSSRLDSDFGLEGSGRSGENQVVTVGAYVDASHPLMHRLHVRGGLRGDYFSSEERVRIAPRLSATWLASESAALTIAAGRYHQQVRAPDSAWIVAAETDYPAGSAPPPLIGVAEATHLALGLNQRFSDEVRLGVEGFYKRFAGIPGASASDASASGMDLWVQGARGAHSAWLGYSLAWVWSLSETPGTSDQFSGRQMLSAGLSGPVAGGLDVDLGFTYGAGLPFTAVPVAMPAHDDTRAAPQVGNLGPAGQAPPLSTPPSDPYLRLDLTLSRTWQPGWNGGGQTLTPYVRVINALDRRDAMFYRGRTGDAGGPQPLSPLPLLPVIGLTWTF
jgi:hypothetical protein